MSVGYIAYQLIKSYLNRRKHVNLMNENYLYDAIVIGVTQGLMFCQLLFLLYVIDI